MLVQINGKYIETTRIEYISQVGMRQGSTIKYIQFFVLLKNRTSELTFVWEVRRFSGETEESLRGKIEGIRDRLAKKVSVEPVDNLDAIINLQKTPDKPKPRTAK